MAMPGPGPLCARRTLAEPDAGATPDVNVMSAPPTARRRTLAFAALITLIRDGRGATAIEYGLIAALIAVAAVTVMDTVGTDLSSTFRTIAIKL